MLTFPDGIHPTECAWQLVSRSKQFKNPYTNGGGQTLALPGVYWTATLTFGVLTRAQAALMAGFIAEMNGMAGSMQIWDHAFATPQGNAGGTPVVDGNGQSGITLNIRGCTPSVTWLKTGDYFQLGNQLHIMTADAATDVTGRCTLRFRAPMRQQPADGTALITIKPKAIMRLKDDNQGMRRSTKKLVISSFSLELEEDITA